MLLDLSPLRKHRDFRLLYAGQFVSAFGTLMTTVAVPVQVYELTHSSFVVGMLGAAQLVPLLAFALWGGAYADAMDRRRLLVASEIVMAFGSLALVLNSRLTHPSVPLIFVVATAMAAVNGFHRPAMEAMTPRLVDPGELTAVAALGALRYSISAIVGPALSGICIATLGYSATYIVDVATFVASIVALAAMRSMPPVENPAQPGLRSILDGLRYARSRPELVGTYVVDLVAMTFAMPMALFPALASQWGDTAKAGWMFSAMSAGGLVTTVLSGWTSRVRRHGAAVVVAAALWGVAIVGFGFAPGMWTALLCLAAAGAADMVSGLFRLTIWNETIPSSLRGRLAGVEMISYLSGPLLGSARAGWMASVSSNRLSIVAGGVTCVLGVLLCIRLFPAFWHYRRAAR